MRKIFVTFLFMIMLSGSALAESKTSQTLSRIENNLFGIEYSKQSENERLSRIEEQVYGEAKTGSIKTRLSALSNDIPTNQMGQEITPKRDTFDDEEDNFNQNNRLAKSGSQDYEEFREPDNPQIDYPVINEFEEQIFGKTYKNLDINTRLSKLEKEVFKKTYEDALSERVERLKEKVAINSRKDDTQSENYYYSEQDNYFAPDTLAQNREDTYYHSQKGDFTDRKIADRDFRAKLNKLEKNVYKQSFSGDTIDNRLSRLESTIFNTNFSSDKETTRLNRISSAVNAQKSAKKYDSNGFQQKMAAAMQIVMLVLMVVAMIL